MTGLCATFGRKGCPSGSKMEPKGSQTRPKTTFADIEFDMVFTVPNPHEEVPVEVREGTFCGLFSRPLPGGVSGDIFADVCDFGSVLGSPVGVHLPPKSVSKRGCNFEPKKVAGPAAGGGSLELKNSSKFAEKHALK